MALIKIYKPILIPLVILQLVSLFIGCTDEYGDCYIDPISQTIIPTHHESFAVRIEIRRNDTIQKFDKIFVTKPTYSDITRSYSPYTVPLNLKTNNMLIVFQKNNISTDTLKIGYDFVVNYNFKCDNGDGKIENRRILNSTFDSTYTITLTK